MKNIKKIAVLSAAIGAMAAFAVPSMASAAVWGPLNTNQTLTATATQYSVSSQGFIWTCSVQLGVHVRTPASSTLDITSASWPACVGSGGVSGCPVSMVPTGLPWTAVATSSTSVNVTMRARVTFGGACGLPPADLQGTLVGQWSAGSHTLTFTNATGLTMSYMGTFIGNALVSGGNTSPTLTLT